jgi:RNA polymerase sigma-70 factor (ECF subfamily)
LTLAGSQFDQLYRAHAANAFRRARRLLGSDADAHEVVHDVFLSLFERVEQCSGHSSMNTFLYSAVTHACLNRIRDQKNRSRLLALHASSVPQPAAALAPADQLALLRALLERIPEPLGQVAVYYYMDELSQSEIARVMGCSRRHIGDLLERLGLWVDQQERTACGS